jgi:hypothetical protein
VKQKSHWSPPAAATEHDGDMANSDGMADSDSSDSESYTKNTDTTSDSNKWVQALEMDPEKNQEPLRPGDVIRYNHPALVAGNDSIRVTFVLSTNPDLDIPLSLGNGEFIPSDTYVRRIKKYKHGVLIDHPGISRQIENFRFYHRALSKEDESGLSGFQNQVERLREIVLETREELKTFPQDMNTMDAMDEPSRGMSSHAAIGDAASLVRGSKSSAVVDVPSPSRVSKLEMEISSPLRNIIAGVQKRSVDPFYKETLKDDKTGLCSVVYKAIGNLTVMVPVGDFNKEIVVYATGPGWRKPPPKRPSLEDGVNKVLKTKGKSLFLRKAIEETVPPHFALAINQNFAFNFPDVGKKAKGRRKKHPFLVGVTGYCSAKKDGCESKFAAGFKEAPLRKLMDKDEDMETIELSITFFGHCVHVKDRKYGSLRGWKREGVMEDFNQAGKTPAEYQKDVVTRMSDCAYHSGNQSHGLSRETSYSISAGAKVQKKLNIGLSKCKLTNVLLSHQKSHHDDLERRVKMQDYSTDLGGIARLIEFVPKLRWYLWTKGSVLIFHLLGRDGRMILNADSTGGLMDIQGVPGVTGKCLVTKLTINPGNSLLKGDMTRDKSLSRHLSPLTAAECISNENKGEE